MSEQLFVFYTNKWVHGAAEGFENAVKEEIYLSSKHNNIEVVSVIAPTFDDCWNATEKLIPGSFLQFRRRFFGGANI